MRWFGIAGRAWVKRDPSEVTQELSSKFGQHPLDRLLGAANLATPGQWIERNGDLLQFFGTARVGKDEASKILRAEGYQPYSFAQPLKQAGQMLFGLTDRETWDDSIKETPMADWGVTPRKIFQLLGTEGARKIYKEEIWGQLAARRWQDIREGNSIDRPWLAPESHELKVSVEDRRDFILRQATRIMFDLAGSPWEWPEDTLVSRVEKETMRAILDNIGMSMEKFWEIRDARPLHAQVSIGPNTLIDGVIGMSTPDVRFEDEGAIIRGDFPFNDAYLAPYDPGCVLVINRILPDEFYKKMKENSTINHASEMGIARNVKDTEIWNDGSLEQLRERIHQAIENKTHTLEP